MCGPNAFNVVAQGRAPFAVCSAPAPGYEDYARDPRYSCSGQRHAPAQPESGTSGHGCVARKHTMWWPKVGRRLQYAGRLRKDMKILRVIQGKPYSSN